jgi:hypothetical protein
MGSQAIDNDLLKASAGVPVTRFSFGRSSGEARHQGLVAAVGPSTGRMNTSKGGLAVSLVLR